MSETLTPSTAQPSEIELKLSLDTALEFEAGQLELYEEAEQTLVDSNKAETIEEQWIADDLEMCGKYVNHEAEYHVGRTFMIGDETFQVWFLKYDGVHGDYQSLWIDIKNLDTGEMSFEVPIEEVDARIKSSGNNKISSPETITTVTDEQVISQELAIFDEQLGDDIDALSRSEFEAFLRGHPELNSLDDKEINNPDIRQEKDRVIQSFEELVSRQPAYEAERLEFMIALQDYLKELRDLKRSDYDIAG